jgi:spore coat protein A, manganese oxidase
MNINRRKAIQLGLAAGGMLLSPIGFTAPAEAVPPLSPRIKRFCTPLPIPDALEPVRTDSDTDYYEIKIQKNIKEIPVELREGGPLTLKMDIWGYNGITPGPTIHQEAGRFSVVRFINELSEDPTDEALSNVIHLHGMNSLPWFDGYALDCIKPCHYKDFEYPNDSAGILWYHDHTIHRTSQNVYKGLAGMYLVSDDHERSLNLPEKPYDIPLILQDRRFQADGQLYLFDDNFHRSLYGDMIFVNGAPWPQLTVERRKYRFRLLNASVSRNYQLALSSIDRDAELDGLSYKGSGRELIDQIIVLGTDEGFLMNPVPVRAPETLNLGIAERYDVIIDFSKYNPGDKIFLRNVGFAGTLDNDRRTHTIMRFDVVDGKPDSSEIPNILRRDEFLDLTKIEKEPRVRKFRFERSQAGGQPARPSMPSEVGGFVVNCNPVPGGMDQTIPGQWKINNRGWDEHFRIADPQLNDYEIWEFTNPGSGWVHPVHPHLIRFKILSRNGRPPKRYETGPKDVVMVGEFETVRVIARFCPHPGLYMMHCHNLVHEDHDMMTQFEVGTGGESPLSRPARSCKEIQPIKAFDKVSGKCIHET